MKTLPTLDNSNRTPCALVILDRDGVINFDSDQYIKNPDEWQAIPGSLEAIARLNRAGIKVGVATNQSGIARGYFDLNVLNDMHQKMQDQLAEVGGHIDQIEYCPDHPDDPGYDRKPNPGMAMRLLDWFNAIPPETYFVGDSMSDLQCAVNAACNPILVKTGKGQKTLEKGGLAEKVPCFDNLSAFVDSLLAR
jgi:D-glycero-D-manno-heptose 1,7-bisphosphate phosphatase